MKRHKLTRERVSVHDGARGGFVYVYVYCRCGFSVSADANIQGSPEGAMKRAISDAKAIGLRRLAEHMRIEAGA